LIKFEDWLKSDDGKVAIDNWDTGGDYEETEYDDYLKDKYEEYKLLEVSGNSSHD